MSPSVSSRQSRDTTEPAHDHNCLVPKEVESAGIHSGSLTVPVVPTSLLFRDDSWK